MNIQLAQALAARMTEVEKMNIRRSQSEDAIDARYHDYRPELSGGNLHGGTEEDGFLEIREVRRIIMETFVERGKAVNFPKGWAF